MNTNKYVHFTALSYFLQDPTWKKAVEIGKASKGLYLFTQTYSLSDDSNYFDQNSSRIYSSLASTSQASSNKIVELWHGRMGHVPSFVLKLLHFECSS